VTGLAVFVGGRLQSAAAPTFWCVLDEDATGSGIVLVPLAGTLMLFATMVGRLITRTGSYKWFMVGGAVLVLVGYALPSRLGANSSTADVAIARPSRTPGRSESDRVSLAGRSVLAGSPTGRTVGA
jgi:hypothetical protein